MGYDFALCFAWACRVFAAFWFLSCIEAMAVTAKKERWNTGHIPPWIRDVADIVGLLSFVGAVHLGCFGIILLVVSVAGFVFQQVQYCTPKKSVSLLRRDWILMIFFRACTLVVSFDFLMYCVFRLFSALLAL